MTLEDEIVHITKLSGSKIYDEDHYRKTVKTQVDGGQFKFIERGDKVIGFYGWLTKETDKGLCIFINNFVLLEKYRENFNFWSLRKFLKEKYGHVYKCEWHNQNRDRDVEFILQRG